MLNQALRNGVLSRLPPYRGSCQSVRDTESFFTLKLSLPGTCVLLDRVLTVLRPLASFSLLKSEKRQWVRWRTRVTCLRTQIG